MPILIADILFNLFDHVNRFLHLPHRFLFRVSKFDKLYEDMTPEEYETVSQRVAALKKLREII